MHRFDETGFFWDDYIAPHVPIDKRRYAPEATWESDEYLPHYDEAVTHRFELMSDYELQYGREPLIWDIEIYPNYVLTGFRSVETKKTLLFEQSESALAETEIQKLLWTLRSRLLVGFNDTRFDLLVAACIVSGWDTYQCMEAVEEIINGLPEYHFHSAFNVDRIVSNHIDLIELTPLGPSLKVCAGRLHAPLMQDLPFKPGKILNEDQITILKWYWSNDLDNTMLLYEAHKEAIKLRSLMGEQYKVDVRSKSDPQVAEAVIRAELKRQANQWKFEQTFIRPGRSFRYKPPAYIQYRSPTMQWVLEQVKQASFVIDNLGSPLLPKELTQLKVPIGSSIYRMGIGGLHSSEKHAVHQSDEEFELTDNDVTSYYPALILQLGLNPPAVGEYFLPVYRSLFERRLAAKKAGHKQDAETLKIVLNGTFGKFGERGGRSIMYCPEAMIAVTVTGQLALLMLIEALELAGIAVVSANTDGVIVKCSHKLKASRDHIIEQWELTTGLAMERTGCRGIYSKDVNNYLMLFQDGSIKAKGIYAAHTLKKNPTSEICLDALTAFLRDGVPIADTVNACQDIRKFVEMRSVRGGAAKNGEYLGKAIRWYFAVGEDSVILNAKNGHHVPRSEGGRPIMRLPTVMPDDLDRARYIARAEAMLAAFYGATSEL